MFTLHDSRDIGMPARACADDPKELHAIAEMTRIPYTCATDFCR